MPLFRSSKVIERQIDEFLDTINEGVLVFRDARSERMRVLYRRVDGRLGLIEPDA